MAAVGFAIGIEITPHLMQHPPAWLAIAVALILGLMGALLAIVLQKFAIAVVGFLAGARLAIMIAGAFFVDYAHYYGITFLIGGILGAVLLLVLFDWALIILSSVEGAHLDPKCDPIATDWRRHFLSRSSFSASWSRQR